MAVSFEIIKEVFQHPAKIAPGKGTQNSGEMQPCKSASATVLVFSPVSGQGQPSGLAKVMLAFWAITDRIARRKNLISGFGTSLG
jgi:hypothetical protein